MSIQKNEESSIEVVDVSDLKFSEDGKGDPKGSPWGRPGCGEGVGSRYFFFLPIETQFHNFPQVTQWKSYCRIHWRCSAFNRLIWKESKCSQVGLFHWIQGDEFDFSGFPPKPLDISDRDRSIESLGVRNGDTIIFQNLKPSNTEPLSDHSNSSSSSSSTSCPPAPSLSKAEGPSEAKRKKTEIGAPKMERQVILWRLRNSKSV